LFVFKVHVYPQASFAEKSEVYLGNGRSTETIQTHTFNKY